MTALLVVAVGAAWEPAVQAASPVELTLTLTPDQGPPGTVVQVHLEGFGSCIDTIESADGSVTFLWDDADIPLEAAVAEDGVVDTEFTVAEASTIGEHQVTARCVQDSKLTASAPFTVTGPTEVPAVVPPLLNGTVAAARQALEDAGLELGEVEGEGDLVVEQSPVAGREVEPGSRVDIVLGSAPTDTVEVPDVIGQRVEEATAELEGLGLAVGPVTGDGEVVASQFPAPGSEVEPGTPVALLLVPDPDARVVVPDLEGRSLPEAAELLAGEGLGIGIVDGTGDLVRAQTPRPGAVVPVGSRVNVSLQPAVEPAELVTVPDLSTLTLAEARAVCARLGLDLVEPVGADGRIVGQQPAAGVRSPWGRPSRSSSRTRSSPHGCSPSQRSSWWPRRDRGRPGATRPGTPPAVTTEFTPHPGPPDQVAIGEAGGTLGPPEPHRARAQGGHEQVELEGTQMNDLPRLSVDSTAVSVLLDGGSGRTRPRPRSRAPCVSGRRRVGHRTSYASGSRPRSAPSTPSWHASRAPSCTSTSLTPCSPAGSAMPRSSARPSVRRPTPARRRSSS
ncbi:PASTA domain-containing protein [Nocardioides sp.]|uniref:PASTA domain-containing protein n=1 Tax=Nocardioides sp. TaxID=35761 RepID=UPI003529C2D0